MQRKHVHIHALYLGSLIIAFVLGGVATAFISIPGFSSAAGLSTLRVSGNIVAGGNIASARFFGDGSGLTNLPLAKKPQSIIGPVASLNQAANKFQSIAACPVGKSVVGGGCNFTDYSQATTYSSIPRADGNSWLCESQAPGGVLDPITKMTSNTAPAPQVASSNPVGFGGAFVAFNKIFTDNWYPNAQAGILQLDFGVNNAKTVVEYTITPDPTLSASPKSWKFEGSNDGVAFTTLDTRTNIAPWGVKTSFGFANNTAYRYYRLNVSATNGYVTFFIYELEMKIATAAQSMIAYALCQEAQ